MVLNPKILSLIALSGMYIGVALIFRLSQTDGQYHFSPLSVMTLAEFCKLLISIRLLKHELESASKEKPEASVTELDGLKEGEEGEESDSDADLDFGFVEEHTSVFKAFAEQMDSAVVWRVLALAVLYAVNNQLTFILFTLVSPAVLSLFKSMASVMTALLGLLLFNESRSVEAWVALMIQSVGLVVAQYDECNQTGRFPLSSYLVALVAVGITAASSVWNSNVIKTASARGISLHSVNIAMYLFGTTLNFGFFLLARVRGGPGFFDHYTLYTVVVVLCNALLGVAVTYVYKYADAVIKTLAQAINICALLFMGPFLFSSSLHLMEVLGALVVSMATYLYLKADALSTQTKASESVESGDSEPNTSRRKAAMCFVFVVAFVFAGSVSLLSGSTPAFNIKNASNASSDAWPAASLPESVTPSLRASGEPDQISDPVLSATEAPVEASPDDLDQDTTEDFEPDGSGQTKPGEPETIIYRPPESTTAGTETNATAGERVKRVAVCMSGAARSLVLPLVHENIAAMLRHIGGPNRAVDLFMLVKIEDEPRGHHRGADTSKGEMQNVVDVLKPAVLVIDNTVHRPKFCANVMRNSHVAQLVGLASCYALVERYANEYDVDYEWYIRVRPDIVYLDPVPTVDQVPQGQVSVPAVHTTDINDHVMYIPWHLSKKYASLADQFLTDTGHCKISKGPESWIIDHFLTNKITWGKVDIFEVVVRKFEGPECHRRQLITERARCRSFAKALDYPVPASQRDTLLQLAYARP